MADIFDNELGDVSSANAELEKAMTAGYGTDAAAYTDGRSLQREDLEATLVSVLDVAQNDCKVFHKLHKQPVTSTVHQIERQTGVGSEDYLFVGEGEKASEADPAYERKIYETKYMSSKWQVSHPLTLTNNVDNPINAQKVSAVLRVTKGTEKAIFHGDSSIDSKQYDGLLKIIRDSADDTSKPERLRASRFDLRGLEVGESDAALGINADLDMFNSITEKVYSKGGDLAEAYFPPVVANQFWNVMKDRLRFNVNDGVMGFTALPDIPTATGSTIRIKGDCGADKMFKVKGVIEAAGDSTKRPNAPTSVTAAATADSASDFTAGFAGEYVYAVHAVNSYGISAGTAIASAVTVAAGNKVTLTITPDVNGVAPTGYIITRTNAGGTELMEMVRVANTNGQSEFTYVDLNKDLPGTASIVLLTPSTNEMKPNASFGQLMGMSNFDLPTDSSLAHRGVVALYGMLELRAPEFCAVIDNVGYAGGLY